jgi:release factor glutamine methyltransferase
VSSGVTLSARTRRAALKEAVALMKSAGLDTPVLDARLIVQHALGVDWETLFLKDDQTIDDGEVRRLEVELARRAAHEPVSRIIGRRHFWTLDLAVSPDTLDPRPETETLIETVVAAIPDRTSPLRILDLGTGTGALLLALLKEYPAAVGIGVDRSDGALKVARANAASHDLADRASFFVGNWALALTGGFDLMVSNPPYIAGSDLGALPLDVRDYDPVLALDGGEDGLDAYRTILPDLSRLLAVDGLAVLEVGADQASDVSAMATAHGLRLIGVRADLAGIGRALSFGLAGPC